MLAYTSNKGPDTGTLATEFCLPDHSNVFRTIDELMGSEGVLLGFIGDIWQPTSVRRILWLQRHAPKLANLGMPTALLARDHPHTLSGFYRSSPLPVEFPLLADPEGTVHLQFHMALSPGLLLIDRHHIIREKWMMSDDHVWPRLAELVQTINDYQATA